MLNYIRLDDVSPVISYDAGWGVGSLQDPNYVYYSDGGTFHSTATTNAKATITFHGTGVALFGAKRFNHGDYSVHLDGATSSFNGYGLDVYEALLFERQGLPDGLHTVELIDTSTNEGVPWLDLDVVQLTTVVPEQKQAVGHDSFTYDPPELWSTDTTLLDRQYNGTVHVSRQAGSTASLTFNGSAVDLYGAICPECGKFSVSLDGVLQTSTPLSSSAGPWVKNSTIFWMARGLDEREHTLVVKSEESYFLAIEGAVVYSAESERVAEGKTVKAKVPVAAIVGGVLGGVILILAALTAILLWRRRQKRMKPIFDLDSSRDPSSPGPFATPSPWDPSAIRTAAISLPTSSPPATIMSGNQSSTSGYMDPLSPLSVLQPGPTVTQAASARRTKQEIIFGVNEAESGAPQVYSGQLPQKTERLPGYGDVMRGA